MMYFNEKEKKIVRTFYNNIAIYGGQIMVLRWENIGEVKANFDTCFENDNELDIDDAKYEEFISFIFKATNIIGNPPIYVTEDEYFMVNYHNFPNEILVDGTRIN